MLKRRGTLLLPAAVAPLAILAQLPLAVNAADCRSDTARVSIATNGSQANDRSVVPAINGDGTVVAFKSYASNLIVNDSNGNVDVFVRDRSGQTTERVSVAVLPGAQPNDNSFPPALDGSGRLVAFGSLASNLVFDDVNHSADLFVYDRVLHTTSAPTLVLNQNGEGVGGGGVQDLPSSVNPDGNLVAFTSSAGDLVSNDNNETNDVFVTDRALQAMELISVATVGAFQGQAANGPSGGPAISADACAIAFYSDATNLVAGDTNNDRDVFVRDRCRQTTERVNVSSTGQQAEPPLRLAPVPQLGFTPAISADGRFVAFGSDQLHLDGIDSGGIFNIFVRDRLSSTTIRVTNGINGARANGPSTLPSFSADGRFLAFQSAASNLIEDDTNGAADIFVVDLSNGAIQRVSVTDTCEQANGPSSAPRISADGRTVTFESGASNLVSGDTNRVTDIFTAFNPLSLGPVVSPTPSPTGPTATPTGPSPTPTGPTVTPTGPTRTPTGPTVTPTGPSPTATGPTRTPTGATATPTGPSPTATGPTRTPTGQTGTPTGPTVTPTGPTRTPTAGASSGGGGGGGCSCRIDGRSNVPADLGLLAALAVPMVVKTLRPRRRRGQ